MVTAVNPAPAVPEKPREALTGNANFASLPAAIMAAPASAAASTAATAPSQASPTALPITPNSANLAAAITAMHQSGQTTATLRLDPPGLGNLTIHLGLGQENAVNVQFITAVPQTTQIIANHLNDLRQAMESAGIALGNTQIGGGNAGGPGGNPTGNPTGNPGNNPGNNHGNTPQYPALPGQPQTQPALQPGIRAVA